MIPSPKHNAWPAPADICGLPVRPLDQQQLIEAMIDRAKGGIPTRVHYLNAHTFSLAVDNADYHRVLAECDLLYADGMSVVWAGRWLGYRMPQRLSAADYFDALMHRCAQEGVRLFFLGGAAGVAATAADVLGRRVPGLRVAGAHCGYFAEDQSPQIIDRINQSGADLLVVGMGSPRQEMWVADHRRQLSPPVCWTVGALLDYFADREPRAPQWLCRWGGEWLFRLMHAPAKRWRRYLVGNTRFVCLVLREWLAASRRRRAA